MLQNLTDGKATIDNSWALIQLGLSYYDQCDFNKAIDSFRLVIRLNSKNRYLHTYFSVTFLASFWLRNFIHTKNTIELFCNKIIYIYFALAY